LPAPTRRPKRLPSRVFVLHDPEAPTVVQAAQIAFKVMAVAKTDTWRDAANHEHLAALVGLTAQQQRILEDHRQILPFLVRRGATVTVLGCTGCDRWACADSKATASKRCTLTLGCQGTPVKASTLGYRQPKELGGAQPATSGA